MKYSYIWSEDRDRLVQSFVDSEPITQVIKEKFVEYEDLVDEIENLPESHIVGPIKISMGSKLIFFFLIIILTFIFIQFIIL